MFINQINGTSAKWSAFYTQKIMEARYIRVSTMNQKTERQLAKSHPNEKLYIDVVSGAMPFANRPKGKELLSDIEQQKITLLTVSSIDRLGRNLVDILGTIEALNHYQTNLKVENLGLDSLVDGKPSSAFKLIVSVMANIAEMEREAILERTREGIEIAKAKGLFKGRKPGSVIPDEDFLHKYREVVKQLKKGKYSLREIAKICNVSLSTVQKVKHVMNKKDDT